VIFSFVDLILTW